MAEVHAKVQGLIDNNPVVVFSKSYCPYCKATKSLLRDLGVKFELQELDQIPDGSAIQDDLEKVSGQRTVPNVFIKQQHIGGNSDVQKLSKEGKLEDLLRQAGALQ